MVKVYISIYNKVVIKRIEFNKYNNSFNIRVLNETILNLIVIKKDISLKVLYKVKSFKKGIFNNNFNKTILKLKRAFNIVF
jgi:hypothetical protein